MILSPCSCLPHCTALTNQLPCVEHYIKSVMAKNEETVLALRESIIQLWAGSGPRVHMQALDLYIHFSIYYHTNTYGFGFLHL